MRHISKLRECTSIAEADKILSSIRAGPAIRKLVETGILLRNHPDKQQREYGLSFLNSAIQEAEDKMDKDEEPTPHHDYGVKPKDDHYVKEELLAGGDKDGNEGSEQSSDNTEPYPQVGEESEDGEEPMQKMRDTDNQMTETYPMVMPGLEPGIANEMGQGMPKLPPMSTPQMMKQMQYTLEQYHRNVVLPMRKIISQQREAIGVLSKQVRESEAKAGSMKLDIDSVKRNALARSANIRETMTPGQFTGPTIVGNGNPNRATIEQARTEIANMDKQIRSQTTMYQ